MQRSKKRASIWRERLTQASSQDGGLKTRESKEWQATRGQRWSDQQVLEEDKWAERLQTLKDEVEERKEVEARSWVEKFQKINTETQQRKDDIARYWSEQIRRVREETQTLKLEREQSCKDLSAEFTWFRQKCKNKHAKIWDNNKADAERLVSKSFAAEARHWDDGLKEALSVGTLSKREKNWLTNQFKKAQKDVDHYEKKSMKKQLAHFMNAMDASERHLDSELDKLSSQRDKTDKRGQDIHEKWIKQMRRLEIKSQQYREYDHRRWLRKIQQAESEAFTQEVEETQAWMKRFWEAREQALNQKLR